MGYESFTPSFLKWAIKAVMEMKTSGFAQKAIERMGKKADGVVVAQ
jgi:hypothetical protein